MQIRWNLTTIAVLVAGGLLGYAAATFEFAAPLKVGAAVVAPGHGPAGDGGVLEAQRQYFVALRAEVAKRKNLAPDRVQADVPAMRDALLKRHATYIDTSGNGFQSQVAQVFKEMTGKEFPKSAALDDARRAHESHHGIAAQ